MMMQCCLLTIIWDIIHCSILELLQRMCLPWRGYQRHCISIFISSLNNQQPCILFYHSYCIPHWSGYFFQSYCCFCCNFYCCSPNSLTLCVRTCHNFHILPWRNFHSCCYFSFIQFSMLEPSLLIHHFTVFFFRSVVSSIIKISIS